MVYICFLQLNQDCQELQKLLKIATRSNVRQLIAAEITLLQGKLHKLQEEHKKEGNDKSEGASNGEQATKEEKLHTKYVFTKKIESYGLYAYETRSSDYQKARRGNCKSLFFSTEEHQLTHNVICILLLYTQI